MRLVESYLIRFQSANDSSWDAYIFTEQVFYLWKAVMGGQWASIDYSFADDVISE